MKKITYLMFTFFCGINIFCIAQNNNNYWYFGNHYGCYFDSLGIHSDTGRVYATEGTASISDGCGLLFYTDGDSVWTKNHTLMQNGFNIGGKCAMYGRSSSTQAALIIRKPASDSLYYIFTTDCVEDSLVDGLKYATVNMNKNNGLGRVTTKNLSLKPLVEEKLTACKHANGRDVWIITHGEGSNEFYSFLLSNQGLSTTPVISQAGQIHDSPNPNYLNARGYLKASANGEMLINVNPDGVYAWADSTLPELFNFDKQTGVVTSRFVIPRDTTYWWPSYSSWSIPFYGATFSPDNTKLYLGSGYLGPNLYQYNLAAGSVANIIASKVLLVTPYPFPATIINYPTVLLNAPDGKIYVSQKYKAYLGVINQPNVTGTACGYQPNAFTFGTGTDFSYWGGLPNIFEDIINPISLSAAFSFYQSNDTVFFNNNSQNYTTFSWNFGDGTTSSSLNAFHVYNTPGTYSVSLMVRDSLHHIEKTCETINVVGVTSHAALTSIKLVSTIYPNPAEKTFEVVLNKKGNYTLALLNTIGETVKVLEIKNDNRILFSCDGFSDGMYFIKINTEHGQLETVKLVKRN